MESIQSIAEYPGFGIWLIPPEIKLAVAKQEIVVARKEGSKQKWGKKVQLHDCLKRVILNNQIGELEPLQGRALFAPLAPSCRQNINKLKIETH
jgi:hypothetical protein